MKIERIASAVLFTMVSGVGAASRERVLPVIEIHASAQYVAKMDKRTPDAIADSVFTSVMSRLDAARKPHAVKAHAVPSSQGSYAADLLWVNSGK